MYYGARYYDPALGRFLSPDSIGVDFTNPQSLNRYSYVGNNPLNHTDPTGHCRPDECDFEPGGENYQGGGDGGGGGDAGGDSGGHDGGAAAFADLVHAIDQIPVAHDPLQSVAIASAVASVDPSDSGGLVNYLLEANFGFGTSDLLANGGFVPLETGTQGTGTGTTTGRLGAALAGLAGVLAVICESGGCNSFGGSSPSSSGTTTGTQTIGNATPLPKGRVLIQIQNPNGYYDSQTVPPAGNGPIATVKQGNIAIDILVDRLVGSTGFAGGDLQALDDAQSRAHRYVSACRDAGGCTSGGSISFDAYGTGYRIDIQIFAPIAFAY